LQADTTRVRLFAITALIFALVFVISLRNLSSRFGKVVLAIRDSESRARFIVYITDRYKVWLFVFSALIAG
ncbi:ABC transporter permease subunit, partial [Marinomonas arenicola]